jgi:sigma-E factor negative regulatory protein RseA
MTDQTDFGGDSGSTRAHDLSALADGELSGEGVRRLCLAWRDDPQMRETWHAYNVIGDVMRSEDLATSITRDERFLADLRARLADEPVVLAPQTAPPRVEDARGAAVASAGGRRANGRTWMAPVAVAAGFVLVVGTLVVVTQAPQSGVTESARSALASSSPVVVAVATRDRVASSPEFVATGDVIRDPQLDRYLLAHKQFAGSTVLGAPSGFLRNAVAEVPAR